MDGESDAVISIESLFRARRGVLLKFLLMFSAVFAAVACESVSSNTVQGEPESSENIKREQTVAFNRMIRDLRKRNWKSANPGQLSSRDLCQYSLDSSAQLSMWVSAKWAQNYVSEAVERGLSISDCERLTGDNEDNELAVPTNKKNHGKVVTFGRREVNRAVIKVNKKTEIAVGGRLIDLDLDMEMDIGIVERRSGTLLDGILSAEFFIPEINKSQTVKMQAAAYLDENGTPIISSVNFLKAKVGSPKIDEAQLNKLTGLLGGLLKIGINGKRKFQGKSFKIGKIYPDQDVEIFDSKEFMSGISNIDPTRLSIRSKFDGRYTFSGVEDGIATFYMSPTPFEIVVSFENSEIDMKGEIETINKINIKTGVFHSILYEVKLEGEAGGRSASGGESSTYNFTWH
jgi:hypothetical protein